MHEIVECLILALGVVYLLFLQMPDGCARYR